MGNENSGWRGPDKGGTHVGDAQVAVKVPGLGVVVMEKPASVIPPSVTPEKVGSHEGKE